MIRQMQVGIAKAVSQMSRGHESCFLGGEHGAAGLGRGRSDAKADASRVSCWLRYFGRLIRPQGIVVEQ